MSGTQALVVVESWMGCDAIILSGVSWARFVAFLPCWQSMTSRTGWPAKNNHPIKRVKSFPSAEVSTRWKFDQTGNQPSPNLRFLQLQSNWNKGWQRFIYSSTSTLRVSGWLVALRFLCALKWVRRWLNSGIGSNAHAFSRLLLLARNMATWVAFQSRKSVRKASGGEKMFAGGRFLWRPPVVNILAFSERCCGWTERAAGTGVKNSTKFVLQWFLFQSMMTRSYHDCRTGDGLSEVIIYHRVDLSDAAQVWYWSHIEYDDVMILEQWGSKCGIHIRCTLLCN